MRERDNRRPAAQVKVLLVAELARDRDIGIVVDDDEAVLVAMRSADFPTFHADWEHRTATDDAAVRTAQQVESRT